MGGRFRLNSIGMMQRLAALDLGIAMLAEEIAAENLANGRLRRVLPEGQATPIPVIAALREPLAQSDDGQLRSKLKHAMTSANIYYSSRKWGYSGSLERAKARLIADISKAVSSLCFVGTVR